MKQTMTKPQFEKYYAKNSNLSLQDLKKLNLHAVKCDCGFKNCNGWRMVSLEKNEI